MQSHGIADRESLSLSRDSDRTRPEFPLKLKPGFKLRHQHERHMLRRQDNLYPFHNFYAPILCYNGSE